jgi:tetratricopeptide (TPR) repeat protein
VKPHAVVIPFAVPAEGRGLGLGLAALVQALVQVEGEGVAIAQLHSRRRDAPPGAPALPLEAFVSPETWRDIAGQGNAPPSATIVVTGVLEPPTQGAGTLELLAFDARDGRTRMRLDLPFEPSGAGELLATAIEQLGSRLGGNVGPLEGLRSLDWEPLESVLYAERCALHDPARGGPHDRLAAMAHLGRAIQDAPAARYPAERLASLALDAVAGSGDPGRLASAATRALERAADDAPEHVELVESLAVLDLRAGQPLRAERRLNEAIARVPRRARLHSLLAQCLRAQGKPDDALAVLQAGQDAAGADLLLGSERGAALAMKGDAEGAARAWQEVLAQDPVHPAAFVGLAGLASRPAQGLIGAPSFQRPDMGAIAATLIDAALGATRAHPEVLRHAVRLVLATETEGFPRAARIASLCRKILEASPGDAGAALALARAHLVLGETALAREQLAWISRQAPDSAPAAEAQALRQALDDPALGRGLDGLLRAAHTAAEGELEGVAARARKLATLHFAWPGWLAAAVAERRLGRWAAARSALQIALEIAPGASGAHLELSRVLRELGEGSRAREHAERALSLEGGTPRALLALAEAFASEGRRKEAAQAAQRALALQPGNDGARAVLDRLRATPKPGWLDRVRRWWSRD